MSSEEDIVQEFFLFNKCRGEQRVLSLVALFQGKNWPWLADQNRKYPGLLQAPVLMSISMFVVI